MFGGYTTKEMKERLGVKDSRPLADFLPTLTIAAKNLATEMTNYNVEEKDLQSVQKGKHDELLKQEGIYKNFITGRKQAVSWKLA